MPLAPTSFDLWIARELAGLIRLSIPFNLVIQSAIRNDILGGLWFGLALFVYWVQSAKNSQQQIQLRILTILLGSTLAILLTILAQAFISWPPPVHYPDLGKLYIGALEPNYNTNCFPSQSVALYGSVAAGIYSINRRMGWVLWIFVTFFVALPRMFVGGHYVTDVLVSFVLALLGYWFARALFETRFTSKISQFLSQTPRLQLLQEIVVFLWIIQVTVEFQGAVWFKEVAVSILR
jgi:membrane-associated phospholipid phosphatase